MEIITKEQISKMSTQEIQEKLTTCRQKLSHMVAIDANEIALCAIYENELQLRKKNGNC